MRTFQVKGGDSDVFLVSLAEKLEGDEGDEESSARMADELAMPLLQEKYQV